MYSKYIGALEPEQATAVYSKMSAFMLIGLVIGSIGIYYLLIKR